MQDEANTAVSRAAWKHKSLGSGWTCIPNTKVVDGLIAVVFLETEEWLDEFKVRWARKWNKSRHRVDLLFRICIIIKVFL